MQGNNKKKKLSKGKRERDISEFHSFENPRKMKETNDITSYQSSEQNSQLSQIDIQNKCLFNKKQSNIGSNGDIKDITYIFNVKTIHNNVSIKNHRKFLTDRSWQSETIIQFLNPMQQKWRENRATTQVFVRKTNLICRKRGNSP